MRPFSGVAQTSVCALCHGANRPPISDSRRQIQAGRNCRAELRSSSPASFHRRSNSPQRHPGIPSRRESAAWVFVRCSTTELQQLSLLAGIEPATVGLVDVTQAFTTPQTFQSFSFPPSVVTSLPLPPRTPVAFLRRDVSFRQRNRRMFSREESALTESGIKPYYCGWARSTKYP
jgi:hypothetical protein